MESDFGVDLDCVRTFSEISDIDIALEGLSGPEEYFAILGDAMFMTSFPLDIIELEMIPSDNDKFDRGLSIIYTRK